MQTITLPVQGLNFATCAAIIEKRLGALGPVAAVDASYVSQTVTVTYDEGHMREETLRELVQDCGFACGQPMTASHLLHAAAEAERAGVPVSLRALLWGRAKRRCTHRSTPSMGTPLTLP